MRLLGGGVAVESGVATRLIGGGVAVESGVVGEIVLYLYSADEGTESHL